MEPPANELTPAAGEAPVGSRRLGSEAPHATGVSTDGHRDTPRAVAPIADGPDNRGMPSWGSYSYLYGPVVALCAMGVLMLVLRWAFGGRNTSVVERPPISGSSDQYGLLDAVASPETYIEAEITRQKLEADHIKATVAMTNDG